MPSVDEVLDFDTGLYEIENPLLWEKLLSSLQAKTLLRGRSFLKKVVYPVTNIDDFLSVHVVSSPGKNAVHFPVAISGSLASGVTEASVLTFEAGYVYYLVSQMMVVGPPPLATTGTHNASWEYATDPNRGTHKQVFTSVAYGVELIVQSPVYPMIPFDSNFGMEIRYQNLTDVAQTNQREWFLIFLKEKVS